MEEDLKKILEENLEISRQSLKILKGIRRSNRISAVFKVFYWLVIIASVVGAYYYLQPYIKIAMTYSQQMLDAFSSIQSMGKTLNSPTGQGISPDILKNLENIMKHR